MYSTLEAMKKACAEAGSTVPLSEHSDSFWGESGRASWRR